MSVSASSNSRSMSARSSYDTGVSSRAAAIAAVVKANFWCIKFLDVAEMKKEAGW